MPDYRFFPRHTVAELLPRDALMRSGVLIGVQFLVRYWLPVSFSDAMAAPVYLLCSIAGGWIAGRLGAVLTSVFGLVFLSFQLAPQPAAVSSLPNLAAIAFLFGISVLMSILAARLRSSADLIAAQRERYARILDNVADAVVVADERGCVEYYNERAELLLDVDARDLGTPISNALRFHRQGKPFDPFRAMRKPSELPPDVTAVARDGRELPVSGALAALEPVEGSLGHAGQVLCLQDLGPLREAHVRLVRSDTKLRAIFESDLIAIFFVRLDGTLSSCNAAFRRLFGIAQVGLAEGRPLRTMTPEAFWPADERAFAALGRTGRCPAYEKQMLRDDGQRVWVTMGGTLSGDGEVVFFVVDSDQRKRAEVELADGRRLLQTIIDRIPAVVAYVGPDGQVALSNTRDDRGYDLLGPASDADSPNAARNHLLRRDLIARALDGETVSEVATVGAITESPRKFTVDYRPYQEPGEDVARGAVVLAVDVSELARQRDELARSEDRFRRLAEASSAVVLHADSTGAIHFASGWREFFGDDISPTLRSALQRVAPEDAIGCRRLLARARATRASVQAELRLRCASDEVRWVAVRMVPIVGGSGDSQHWIVGIRDTHERREALRGLHQAKDELRLILDTMPARIAYFESNHTLRWANVAFLQWFDLGFDHCGAPAADILPVAVAGDIESALTEAMALGDNARREWEFEHPRFGRRWTVTTVAPDVDAGGRVRGLVTLCVDDTDRKLAEDAMQRSHREQIALAEIGPNPVWIADADGHMRYVNQRWSQYTGLDAESDWELALHPEDRAAVRARFLRALEEREAFNVETRLRRVGDGVYRWHVMSGVPVRQDENAERWFGGFTDIEDQKQAQGLLHRAQDNTHRFLSVLSHELRNPLAVLSTSAYLLLQDPDAARARAIAEAIDRQTQHLKRLVDDLLDFSRITEGKIRLQPGHCDLGRLVREACADFSARAARQSTRIDCRPGDDPVVLYADPARVRQIIDNLLSNALKATAEGGVVTVECGYQDGVAVLRVIDDGSGIDEATATRIFEPFVQAPGWTERGLGLGLSVVAQLARLHDGDVRAITGADGGACFEVRMPLRTVADDLATSALPTPARAVPAAAGRVLVVDDVEDHARALVELLRAVGLDALAHFTGQDAVAWAQHEEADAVVCDIGLPEPWNGYQVANRLREIWGERPLLLAYSGFGDAADVERARRAGFDRHILKPAPPMDIIRVVKEGIEQRARGAGR